MTLFPWWDSSTLTRLPTSPSPRFLRVSRGLLSCGRPLHMSKIATSFPSRTATPQEQVTA